MEGKIMVLSPNLDLHGGNLVTLSRISDHLVSHGYSCELSSPMAFPDQEAFLHKVKNENIQLLIGIHAHKTGIFMKDSRLPFILIIGGTDVNVMAEDPKKLKEMSHVVSHARYVVCFSSELRKKAKKLWPDLEDSHLKIIPQGIELHLLSEKIDGSIIKKCLHDAYKNNNFPSAFQHHDTDVKPIVFTLIAGVRPVKNPVYLIKTFQEWHERDDRIFFLIVGQVSSFVTYFPYLLSNHSNIDCHSFFAAYRRRCNISFKNRGAHKLDASYTEKEFLPVVNSKPGVLFVPGVSISEAHAIVRESFASVNSSDNEGMSLAILESMALGVPVLARDNPGNRSIVGDDNTGLVFSSPQTFATKAKWLLDNPKDRTRIVNNAKEFVMSNHSLDSERLAYVGIVKQGFQ